MQPQPMARIFSAFMDGANSSFWLAVHFCFIHNDFSFHAQNTPDFLLFVTMLKKKTYRIL